MNLLPAFSASRTIADFCNQVYCMDALDLLRALPDASVDLIATDPPYGLAVEKTFIVSTKYYSAVRESWDYFVPLEWMKEVRRVLKPTGSIVCFCGRKSTYEIAGEALRLGWRLINDITWYKPDAMPNMTGRMMTESTERALWFSPHGSKWFYDLSYAKYVNNGNNFRDVWEFGTMRGNRLHPTQKPEDLFERIVNLMSPFGGVILDPFLGSGTTAIAARKLGRRYIGCDLSPEYVALARQRIAASDPYQDTVLPDGSKQLSLFTQESA